MQRRSSSFINKVIGGCPIGKVPIYKKRVRHQNIINASSKLQTEDFHQDYEHYNSDHVSDIVSQFFFFFLLNKSIYFH